MSGEGAPVAGRNSVIRDVATWLNKGERSRLCTIVGPWGSSPRSVDSWRHDIICGLLHHPYNVGK